MPKVIGPLFSLSARKTIRKILTFQRRPSGTAVCKYAYPGSVRSFTPSDSQVTQRAAMAALVTQWQGLSAAEKAVWDAAALAAAYHATGYHYFIHLGGVVVIELDYMEYASDALAQAAYLTSSGWDSYVKSLLHMDGVDESVVFTDESGKTWTAHGDAQINTADKVFGTGSGLFDGAGDYVDTPDHADFALGSGDFTISVRYKRLGGDGTNRVLIAQSANTALNATIGFMIMHLAANTIQGRICVGAAEYNATSTATITDSDWHHIALVRHGNTMTLYIDGGADGSVDVTGVTANDSVYKVAIGRLGEYNGLYLNGSLDELRISVGIARWISNFTPRTSEYGQHLQCYSEDTIKEQGLYSLKALAAITKSLNDTLTRTVDPTIDLSGCGTIYIDVRASRTGIQFKIAIHDSGGTTTEKTINIAAADTWQEVEWDISGVADVNKDAIDQIIITITNADASNTIYLDNMYA